MELLPALLFVLTVGCFQLTSGDDCMGPIYKTSQGKIQGTIIINDGGLEFFAFRGIPYAKPPVKERRFKVPEALLDGWSGVLDATDDGAACIQYMLFDKRMMGDEDCLYLNVFTPKMEAQKFDVLLPVMVYIHGGGFFGGSGASSFQGPQRLMSKPGIVLVTINYRLGPFGFLTTMDKHSPGNYGLLDQVMALEWVRDNIAAFGGDPGHVTIFGESAGGASVGFHVLSPLSKGLFHAAITQSGSVLSEWATPFDHNDVVNTSKELAKLLSCPTDSHKAMMKCLMRLPALDIIVKTAILNDARPNALSNLAFKPVVDQTSCGVNSFLPDTPQNLLTSKRFNRVPIISGVNKDEGILFMDAVLEAVEGSEIRINEEELPDLLKSNRQYVEELNELLRKTSFEPIDGSASASFRINEEKLPALLKSCVPSLFKNEDQWRRISKAIISSYFENMDVTYDSKKLAAVENMISDCFITYKVDVQNELFAKYDLPIFLYKFTYRGEYSLSDRLTKDMVSHADELRYLFLSPYYNTTKLSEADAKMSDILLTLWTNFAKTKVPSLLGSSSPNQSVTWEPISSVTYKYLELNLTPAMVDGRLSINYDLWRDAYLGKLKDEL